MPTMQDFYGFSFNGYHSSELGFIRVSGGDRYEDTVGPNFQDKTVQVPGMDGTYFFESYYTQKPFTINIAFDSMTEKQLRDVRQVFNGKDVGPLVFDENPYKAYIVKLQSPIQLKYICFNEPAESGSQWIHNTSLNPRESHASYTAQYSPVRVYKGEGTIQLIAYKPYAYSVGKTLEDFSGYSNLNEWKEASGLPEHEDLEHPQGPINETDGTVAVKNVGDVPTDFKLYFSADGLEELDNRIYLELKNNGTVVNALILDFSEIAPERFSRGINFICVDTQTNLIEGCDALYDPSGALYNDAIKGGDFFKLPVTNEGDDYSLVLKIDRDLNPALTINKIDYNYLYY